MKAKVLTILLTLSLCGIFSACSEEEVVPLNNHEVKTDGQVMENGF